MRLIHVAAPSGSPPAFRYLSDSFGSMLALAGMELTTIAQGDVPSVSPDVVFYSLMPQPEILRAYPRARHVQPFVDGDLPPTHGVDQIYPSHAWRDQMAARYPWAPVSTSPVIPNWVDPEDWPIGEGLGDYVAYVGRLDRAKRGMLYEIAAAMPAQRFVVAGAGPRCQLSNVEHLGHVPRSRLASLMGAASAVLCPTLYCEPFGLAAVEAGLTGARVIASDVGAFREILPTCVDLVSPTDVGEWVRAISRSDLGADRRVRREWHQLRHSPETVARLYVSE